MNASTIARSYDGPTAAATSLLIVQPTPFCNIQCDYCYLPDRHRTDRLSRSVFRDLIRRVFDAGLVSGQLSLIWHAGEPLVVPPSYYRDLLTVFDELDVARARVRQSVQTNGMLISDGWCDFFREERINVGVSMDGPAFLHDRHRVDRQGHGTHARALEGIRRLQAHGIDFHVIAVATADALDHADAIMDFFLELGVKRVGFNVEELEAENRSSSLIGTSQQRRQLEARIRRFWERLYERQVKAGTTIQVREFVRAYRAITEAPPLASDEAAMQSNPQTAPLGILSCDWQGHLSTFSPELLGVKSAAYGDFTFGSTAAADLRDLLRSPTFNLVASEIHDGVKACARECQYFGFCGGGAPSNKYFENGSFASTETMYCRTTVQMPIDIVLARLERALDVPGSDR